MPFERTNTAVLLTDGSNFYWVSLLDLGDGILVADADTTNPVASDSDGYVPLLAPNGTVYRWKLKTEDGITTDDFVVSPDQNETTETVFDLELDGTSYHVSLLVFDDGEGNDIITLDFVEADERSSSSSSDGYSSSSSSSSQSSSSTEVSETSSSSSSSQSSSSSSSSSPSSESSSSTAASYTSSSSSSEVLSAVAVVSLNRLPDDGLRHFRVYEL